MNIVKEIESEPMETRVALRLFGRMFTQFKLRTHLLKARSQNSDLLF